MKRSQRSKAGLVIEHLEGISRTAIKRYPEIIIALPKVYPKTALF